MCKKLELFCLSSVLLVSAIKLNSVESGITDQMLKILTITFTLWFNEEE